MNATTKPTSIVLAGITLKAQGMGPHGASVQVEQRFERTRYNVVRGLTDLVEISRAILIRLDLEAAQRGPNAVFPCGAMRTELREALRGCDGLDRAPSAYFDDKPAAVHPQV